MKSLRKKIIEFFQGVAIGIANVIPGFSGGTMAVIFNVYERIISAFSNIFKHPLKVIKDIWVILVGLVTGIILSVFVIVKLLEIAPIPTIMFFIGLIIGSIPFIFIASKENGKISYKEVISLVVAMAILIALPFLKSNELTNIDFNFGLIVIMFLMGIIAAATMIIPGVSGSLILMVFGYYFVVTDTLKNLFNVVLNWDFTNFWNYFFIIFSFGVGAILGVVYISKIIKWLFKKYPKIVYFVILGFLIASPFSMIISLLKEYPNAFSETSFWGYACSIISMALGILIAGYFSLYEKKNKKGNEILENNEQNKEQV